MQKDLIKVFEEKARDSYNEYLLLVKMPGHAQEEAHEYYGKYLAFTQAKILAEKVN